jgi:hypothetical protein
MNLNPLIALIEAHGLSAYQADLLTHVRPAIALQLEAAQPGAVGQSRIGGVPDLPPSISWLHDKDVPQKYVSFLLQINLAELPLLADHPLPQQGMMYLFAPEEGTQEHFVLYVGNEPLTPASQPSDDEIITDWCKGLIEHRLSFRLFADLPRWATREHQVLCDRFTDVEDEDRYNALTQASDGNSVGKLLGHVAGIGHDPREDAYVVNEVNPDWLYDYEQRRNLNMQGADHWRNLLYVDSSKAVNLMIGDAGAHLLVGGVEMEG